MEKLLTQLFPEGKRKLVVSVAALILAFAIEKYMGGLSDDMMTAIIAIVGIFATGNVGEHFANALKAGRTAKVQPALDVPQVNFASQQDEDVDDGTQEMIQSLQQEVYQLRQANEKTNVTLSQLAQVVSNILNRQAGAPNVGQAQRPQGS